MTDQNEKAPNRRLTLMVDAECIFDPARSENIMHFSMNGATVSEDGDDGTKKEVGEIVHALPAGIDVHDRLTKETWAIGPRELWEAYTNARDGKNPTTPPEVISALIGMVVQFLDISGASNPDDYQFDDWALSAGESAIAVLQGLGLVEPIPDSSLSRYRLTEAGKAAWV